MQIKIKLLYPVLPAIACGLFLAACGKSSDQAGSATASDKPAIALVMKSLANEFFKTMEEGAEKHHAENPDRYELIVNGIKNKSDVSAQRFAQNWTATLIWSGFEIGIAAAYPWQSIQEDYDYVAHHPVKEGYLAYVPEHPHDRPTWDLTAVLEAVYPDRGYFDLSSKGSVIVEDDGATRFSPGNGGLASISCYGRSADGPCA